MVKKDDSIDTHCTKHRARTHLIHGEPRSTHWDYNHHVVPPMTASATFRLDNVERGAQGFADFAHTPQRGLDHPPIYVYDRLDEPTRAMLEENLAIAERADMALCFASGMAAISATLCTLTKTDDHIIAHDVLYGCTYSLLTGWFPRHKIGVSLLDLNDHDVLRKCFTPQTRVVYFETPVNPDLMLIDIAAISDIVGECNQQRSADEQIHVVVDNTFATPFCQRPLECGADVVCLSLTKGIGGFGTAIGGAVVGPQWLHDPLIMYRKDYGASLAPHSAWSALVYGLPTLATRMVNYQKSAMHVARFLEQHPKIECVRYPGLDDFDQADIARKQMHDENKRFAPGCMIWFVLKDTEQQGEPARRLVNWIASNGYSITLAVSLGQVKTLIECPYSMTHAALPEDQKLAHNLEPSGCRLSVGLEDWHDIVADLEEGLCQV